MFGFIKFIQRLLERLRANKRLWFTTIFLISVFGISASIFFLTLMTGSISKEVYKNQVLEYKQRYEAMVKFKETSMQKCSLVVLNDKTFIDALRRNDIATAEKSLETLNKTLSEHGFEKTHIAFKSVNAPNLKNTENTVMKTKNTIFGLEVFSDGVFYTYLTPVVVDDNALGLIEIRSSIDNIFTSFSNLNQEFVFFLNKSMAVHIALEQRNENYESFNDSLLLDNRVFNSSLTRELKELSSDKYSEFLDSGYYLTRSYYAAHIDIEDTNGIPMGMIVLAEDKYKESGFVNIINKMKNQVILVALGLIVSILLFMF